MTLLLRLGLLMLFKLEEEEAGRDLPLKLAIVLLEGSMAADLMAVHFDSTFIVLIELRAALVCVCVCALQCQQAVFVRTTLANA